MCVCVCACVCVCVGQVSPDVLRPHISDLAKVLLQCFRDDSWLVRDGNNCFTSDRQSGGSLALCTGHYKCMVHVHQRVENAVEQSTYTSFFLSKTDSR